MDQEQVRVGSAYLEGLEVKVAASQGYVLLSQKVVRVITEDARGVINEVPNAGYLALMTETRKEFKDKF